jgi:hypothetical protein
VLTAFGFLCEEENDHYPITQWTFAAEVWPAVLRMLESKECFLERAPTQWSPAKRHVCTSPMFSKTPPKPASKPPLDILCACE